MSTNRLPIVVLITALLAFALSLVWSYGQLPAQVATHFNAAGQANDWMSREMHLTCMAAIGLGLPILMVGVFYAIRWLPMAIVNMPHREYWLAPERRLATSAVLLQFGLWFASFESLFFLAIHILVVQANRAQPATLSNAVWILLVAFLAFVGVWLFLFWRTFRVGGRNAAVGAK